MITKNPCGKSRKTESPYAVFKGNGPFGPTECRVLKCNQSGKASAANPYASWFVHVVTPMTGAGGDMGDSYIRGSIIGLACTHASDAFLQWAAEYGRGKIGV